MQFANANMILLFVTGSKVTPNEFPDVFIHVQRLAGGANRSECCASVVVAECFVLVRLDFHK